MTANSQQNLNLLSVHRRDRSQRINERNGKPNYNSDELTNNNDISDTQVMSIRMDGSPGPKTEQLPGRHQGMLSDSNRQLDDRYNLELYRKKLLSASVAQISSS